MPDHSSRAVRYRDRADECRRLAELTSNISGAREISDHYRTIAEHYLALAHAEELLLPGKPSRSTETMEVLMDRETLLEHLLQTERHVAEGERDLSRQRQLIEQLERDKDQPRRIKQTLLAYPTPACTRHVRSLLLSGGQAFF
jgi:hypothetical protein